MDPSFQISGSASGLRELCSLPNQLSRVDLVMRLMQIAHSCDGVRTSQAYASVRLQPSRLKEPDQLKLTSAGPVSVMDVFNNKEVVGYLRMGVYAQYTLLV